jgi:hypothetical protein
MENKFKEIAKKEIENFGEKKISRKDAIKRTGYMAVSAATMMILLSNSAQADGRGSAPSTSKCAPPPNKSDGNHGGGGGPWGKKN